MGYKNLFLILTVAILIFVNSALAIGAERERNAAFSLMLDSRGSASLSLALNFQPDDTSAIESSLREALGSDLRELHTGTDDGYEEYSKEEEGGAEVVPWWSLYARCDRVFSRRGLRVEGQIDLAPLVRALNGLKVESLVVTITHPRMSFSHYNQPPQMVSSNYNYDIASFTLDVESAPPPPIRLVYGYHLKDLFRIYSPYAAVLFLPILAVLWRRRVALRAYGGDPSGAWFGYCHFLQIIMAITWFGWIVVVYPIKLKLLDISSIMTISRLLEGRLSLLKFVMANYGPINLVFTLFCYYLPPAILNVICYALSHPVITRVRGMQLTLREVVVHSILSQLANILPLAIFFAGVFALISGNLKLALICFAIALICRRVCSALLMQAKRIALYLLKGGELRERVVSMAGRAGVKLKEVYVLSTGREPQAKAYSTQTPRGNGMVLTDSLLPNLNKREVDAVVAHELAHLKLSHPRILASGIGLLMGLPGLFSTMVMDKNWALVLPLFSVLTLMVYLFFKRRFEYSADAEAVTITGDPEALMTALIKVDRFNMTPMHPGRWLEQILIHPSTQNRVQAIAERGSVPIERLQEMLSASDIISELDAGSDYYDLHHKDTKDTKRDKKSLQDSGPKIFTRTVRNIFIASTLTLIAMAVLLIEGSPLRQLLDAWRIPAILLPLSGAFVTGALYCFYIRYRLLGALPAGIKFIPTAPINFPLLNRDMLEQYTAAIKSAGFRWIMDYSIEFEDGPGEPAFGRYFSHPEHHCVLEVSQIFPQDGNNLSMRCGITSLLEDDWSYHSTAAIPFACLNNFKPKRLFSCHEGAGPDELLQAHLAKRDQISSATGCKVLTGVSLRELFAREQKATADRLEEIKRSNILLTFIKAAIFEYRPTLEWVGGVKKNHKDTKTQRN
jgi:Zn-dependent protease with chaperone function